MKRSIFIAIVLLISPGCSASNRTLPAAETVAGPVSPGAFSGVLSQAASPIRHIVIIFQENRTPDNLFQGLHGADIASSGLNEQGQRVKLHPVPLTSPYDLSHRHSGFLLEYAGGKMNGWSSEPSSRACPARQKNICAYGYVPSSENGPYMAMARQYVFADRMFQSNQGPSYPAHQFIISADADAMPASPLEIANNPTSRSHFHGFGGGCDAPKRERVGLISARGGIYRRVYPCFDRPVLSDLLDAKGLTWRYYQHGGGQGLWKAFDSIRHVRYGQDYANVITNPDLVLHDIAHGNLADVVWVTPAGYNSDHAGAGRRGGGGPAWVAAVVNAIGKSRYWKSTAILITWDDWGGWFDHVKPPVRNSDELGFRVPLIVISPYAKKGYVSHDQYEFGSLFKFAENTFNLGTLGKTDKTAEGLDDCFDFKSPPRRFRRIPAPPYRPQNATGRQPPPDDDF